MAATSSTTDSAQTICTSRLAVGGKSQIGSYCEASTSSSTDGMLLTKTGSPSTSTEYYIDSEMPSASEINAQKLDQKIDIDDTCSNDAFVFNSSLKGKPLKSNQKTATVPYNGPK